MYNNLHFILGICFGLFRINHAADHKISDPVIIERNCTHVKFSLDVEYGQESLADNYVRIYESETDHIASTGFDRSGIFHFLNNQYDPYKEYVTLKAIPIPKTWEEKHTLFITFQFPDERVAYTLIMELYMADPKVKRKFPFAVGKSRCFPEEGITGCDGPSCVCDTVVTKTCPSGSTVSGKCTDFVNPTNNSANFTFAPCDVDECLSGNNKCNENADCTNTVGSYECTCRTGYEGDGINCEDINDCASSSKQCDENANCINFPGSYTCTCKTGYEGDGKNCRVLPGQRSGQSFLLIGGVAAGVITSLALIVCYKKKNKELRSTASDETTTKHTFIEK